MRVSLVLVLIASLAALAPVATADQCSICEFLVEEIISKGTCDGLKAACVFAPPPGDAACEALVGCCCGILLHYVQEHIGDASEICGFAHLCPGSKAEALRLLHQRAVAWHRNRTATSGWLQNPALGGPTLPEALAMNIVGVQWDASRDRNFSYGGTYLDDYALGARRYDWTTFDMRGTNWVEGTKTNVTTMITQIGNGCSERKAYSGPPLVNDRHFWETATPIGREHRSLVGEVQGYSQLKDGAHFVGFFRPDGLPAEVWVMYNSSMRQIDIIGGEVAEINRDRLIPCIPVPPAK